MMAEQEWVDPSSREQVTIMVITTAVQFACSFGMIALVLITAWDIIHGTLSSRQTIAFFFCFWMTLWTGYRAMHLVVRPTRIGLLIVLLGGLACIAPIVSLEF